MTDLQRIANALEHLAFPAIGHPAKSCAICLAKTKPVKKMPPSRVLNDMELVRRGEQIRQSRLLHGPEQPVEDMFRYRESNQPPKNS